MPGRQNAGRWVQQLSQKDSETQAPGAKGNGNWASGLGWTEELSSLSFCVDGAEPPESRVPLFIRWCLWFQDCRNQRGMRSQGGSSTSVPQNLLQTSVAHSQAGGTGLQEAHVTVSDHSLLCSKGTVITMPFKILHSVSDLIFCSASSELLYRDPGLFHSSSSMPAFSRDHLYQNTAILFF